MAKVTNVFINGRMDSDTHYSLLDNKSYVRAENIRLTGDGDDGAFKSLKGSDMVSDFSENGAMVIIGIHRGLNNKLYYFLAQPNGKSKIIQYDVETKQSQLIIQDNTVLRFDLIRWNNGIEIFPYKYLLSFNQVGDLIIFSNEIWENIRCINLSRLSDYAVGFTEEDITLNKKPPTFEPKILQLLSDTSITDKTRKDAFVSFAYRYKYKDGDWSALSFFSDTAFEMGGFESKGFEINSERLNLGMTNKISAVKLMVNSGDNNVTDIQVIAIEHGSNTAYIIYDANKKKLNIPDNIDSYTDSNFQPIYYRFSKNYKILTEDAVKLLYSNTPKFPKTQDVAGSRLFVANYKEGYDLKDKNGNDINIDISLRKDTLPFVINQNNPTACSLFSYSIGMAYYDDYNQSITVLENHIQSLNELQVGYEDRLVRNIFKAKPNHQPPTFATKFKWIVKAQELNYEIIYPKVIRKIGTKVYIKLEDANINKIKENDTLIPISDNQQYGEYFVEKIKTSTGTDGEISLKGTFAVINADNLVITQNAGLDIKKTSSSAQSDPRKNAIEYYNRGVVDPERFVSLNKDYSKRDYPVHHRTFINYVDFGAIKEGNIVNIDFNYKYFQQDVNDTGLSPSRDYSFPSNISFRFEFFADRNYNNIGELLLAQFEDERFTITNNGTNVIIDTNKVYADYLRENYSDLYNWASYRYNSISEDWKMAVIRKSSMSLTKGYKPITFRTQNKEVINEFYFETPKTYPVINGQHIGAEADDYFDVGFYNAYCWGNGVESYKIKDAFNAKKLNYRFRGNAIAENGYKQIHRSTDITYSGIFNNELGLNQISVFNPTKSNWKPLPIKYGEIERIVSTDGDLKVFFNGGKIVNQYYGKSLIADLQGNESLALSNDVLGAYRELPYEIGISTIPESIAKSGNLIYFGDRYTAGFYVLGGDEIQEINPIGSGFHNESVKLLKNYHSFLGSYDEAYGEYVVGIDQQKIVRFSLGNKGFTAYQTVKYDYLFGMNGSHFTGYKGKLYENEVNENHQNIAGQGKQQGKIKIVVNANPSEDKVFKAMYLQSNTSWNTEIKTNLTATQFSEYAYQKRESYYYTDIFRDSSTMLGLVGAGIITDIQDNTIIFKNKITNQISVGESLVNETQNYQSEITAIIKNTITVSNASGFNIGDFVAGQKKQLGTFRPNGVPIRGKWMEVTLSKYGNEPYYISAVYTEVIKSQLT